MTLNLSAGAFLKIGLEKISALSTPQSKIKGDKFFESNKDQIIEIYSKEKEKQGQGVLFISFLKDKVDIYYIKYNELSDKIKDKCSLQNKTYFYISKPETKEEFVIKLDGI